VTNSDWYTTGIDPEPQGLTEKQRYALLRSATEVLEILTPEERVNAELMGFDRWVENLDKWDATRLIGVLKGDGVAAEVRRRSAGRLRAGERKWFDTGFKR